MKFLLSILLFITLSLSANTNFLDDYDEALKVAKVENKDIYMLITSESCRWCRKFENVTLKDKATIDMLKKKFVLLALSRDLDFIPEMYKAKRVPKHYFIRNNGEVIYSFLGYWNAEDFASFMIEVEKRK